ncbi:hypothetical protein ES703_70401 [subsurface metagenome]
MPPVVSALNPVHLLASSLKHHHILYTCPVHRLIGIIFQIYRTPTAVITIAGDQSLGVGIYYPVFKRFSTKGGEDNAMWCSNASTSQHCYLSLGYHRQIDTNPVSFSNAKAFQNIGKLVNLTIKVIIGQNLTRFINRLLHAYYRHLVSPPGFNMSIYAVIAGVQFATNEPLKIR